MPRLIVKNWSSFQHYKDRAPPWIKLHKGLLDNYEYQRLPIASRALAPMLWLLASESEDGSIEYDCDKIAFRLRTTKEEVTEAIEPLIQAGFLAVLGGAINPLADCKQGAMPEKEAEAYKPEAEKRESKSREKSRGSRLATDAALSDEWLEEAAKIRPDLPETSIAGIFAEFKDYWIALSGQKATKTDWLATWRNWVRREKGFKSSASAPSRPPSGRQSNIDNYAAQASAVREKYEPSSKPAERDITSESTVVA